MKKLLYVAVMALTMGFFVSCNNGPRLEMKYAEGEWPQAAIVVGVLNGQRYDQTTKKCWELTLFRDDPEKGKVKKTEYHWGNEFEIAHIGEQKVAEQNHHGIPAAYTYQATEDSYDDCDCGTLLELPSWFGQEETPY